MQLWLTNANLLLNTKQNVNSAFVTQTRIALSKVDARLALIEDRLTQMTSGGVNDNHASGRIVRKQDNVSDELFELEKEFHTLNDEVKLARHFFNVADIVRSKQREWIARMFNKLLLNTSIALQRIVLQNILKFQ